jgi:hypothetical protein
MGDSNRPGGDSVTIHPSRRTARVVAAGLAAAAAAASAATPASAKQIDGPAASASRHIATCEQMPYQDRTQVRGNAAGVVFVPKYDNFKIWDNDRDGYDVHVWFNYAGVKDFWKPVPDVDDGGQGPKLRELSERFKEICFYIETDSDEYPNSPIVRYTTRP